MFSLQDENIHNIAIEGVFDDCQDIVKAVSNDADRSSSRLCASARSTRSTGRAWWPRWCTTLQRWLQATKRRTTKVVRLLRCQSGNFGNVCAGHVARMHGPAHCGRLVVRHQRERRARRVLPHRRLPPAQRRETHETSSPSMDISKASNFERFVFDLLARDAARTAALFGPALTERGGFDLSADPAFATAASRYGFASGKSTHAERLATIARVFKTWGVMIDTHTADAVKVAEAHAREGTPMIVLETALPIKFAATIRRSPGLRAGPAREVRGHRVAPTACDRDAGAGAGGEAFHLREMCLKCALPSVLRS
jgi:threonine synthase